MKRMVLSVASVGLCIAGCVAQDGGSSTLWGLRAAIDFNLPGKWRGENVSFKMYNPGLGFTLGGVCNIYLSHGFYLEPGVSFFYDTYSYRDLVIGNPEGNPGAEDPGLYKLGVRVPVVAGYTLDISEKAAVCFYTGPEFSYAFGGKVRLDENESTEGIGELFGDWHRRADVAWKVGVGFPYKSLMMSVDAAFGLTDLLKSGMSFRENRLSVSLAYYM